MFIIYDKNMNEIGLPHGALPLDIYISSIQKRRPTSDLEGMSGVIDYGLADYKTRPITIDVGLLPEDTQDYRLLRDEIYDFFQSLDYFYISEKYQRGKRYKVNVTDSFTPDRLAITMAQMTFPLENIDLPFSESIKTTSDIDKNGLNYGDGWYYGMGLLYDEASHKYTHTSRTFKIYNAGSVPIHPFEQELIITIEGASKGYELENITTDDVFKVTKDLNGKIVIDGPVITDNGSQALRKTNKTFITLAPGWNEFRQNQNAKVFYDFRFYYH